MSGNGSDRAADEEEAGSAGVLTSDAHLAALAIEQGCRLYSNDRDFGRFKRLQGLNPLT
ncbi:MAG: hypothetical protein ACOCXA_06675 [Planctomycetota bacterium]